MQRPPLHRNNRIRVLRRRLGLNQTDIAFLLNDQTKSYISKLEDGSRGPSLYDAFVLEVIFDTPVRRIFDGGKPRLQRTLVRRIASLITRLKRWSVTPRRSQRIVQLRRILASLVRRRKQ